MLISELSRRTGISRHTIRYYEKFGLIEPHGRQENNYRYYSEDDLATIAFIDRVKRLGFSLREIREFLDVFARDVGSGRAEPAKIIRAHLEQNRDRSSLPQLIALLDEDVPVGS